MTDFLNDAGAAAQPEKTQTEQASSGQVQNTAGGFVFAVGDLDRVRKFLVLGTEGGTFYINEKQLTKENCKALQRCLTVDGKTTIDEIVKISQQGRAPKNDYALFALAVACSHGEQKNRLYALEQLSKVARTGTHLFHFVEYLKGMRGFGPAVRKALSRWYLDRDPGKLEYQIVKYKQRDGWSHRDVLRKAHTPLAKMSDDQKLILEYAVVGWVGARAGKALIERVTNREELARVKGKGLAKETEQERVTIPDSMVHAYGMELAKGAGNPKQIAEFIRTHDLKREMLPNEFLKAAEPANAVVWEALLEEMPYTAMIRNLANMTRVGLLQQDSKAAKEVVSRLLDAERLKKARVHPIQVLAARLTYESGGTTRNIYGIPAKEGPAWTPVQSVVDALEEAFYLSFQTVTPTGKRFLIGQDVSGSMHGWHNLGGVDGLSCAVASACLAMVTVRSEPSLEYMGFGHKFEKLGITKNMKLDKVVALIRVSNFGSTDCSLPLEYASKHNLPVDCFAVYTDNETYAGKSHPHVALQKYRQKTGINAKMVVIGMTASGFSIADPKDPGMLDVVGFDTATPAAISMFVNDGAASGAAASESEEE